MAEKGPVVEEKEVHGEELINLIVARLWKHLEVYLNQEEIKEQVMAATDNFVELRKVKLWDPMVLLQAKVLKRPWHLNPADESIVFEFEADFKNIEVLLADAKVGIPFGLEVSFRCTIRVTLNHLTSDFLPLYEAVTMYFTEDPKLHFNFLDAGNVLDMPGLKGKLNSITRDTMNSLLVYPNRLAFKMNRDVELSRYQFPLPIGLLRVQVAQIEKLSDNHEAFGKIRRLQKSFRRGVNFLMFYWLTSAHFFRRVFSFPTFSVEKSLSKYTAPDFFYRLSCVYGRFKSEVVESKTKEGDTEWKQTVDILVTEPDLEYLKIKVYEEDVVSDDFAGEVFIQDLRNTIALPSAEKNESGKDDSSLTKYRLKGDKTGEATIFLDYISFNEKLMGEDVVPIKTIPDSVPLSNQFFVNCYITKVETNELAKEDEREGRSFVFYCLEDDAQIKDFKSFSVDKKGVYKVPMVTRVLLKSMPAKLNFAFSTDKEELKESQMAKFSLDTNDLDRDNFAKRQLREFVVEGVGTISMTLQVATLQNGMGK